MSSPSSGRRRLAPSRKNRFVALSSTARRPHRIELGIGLALLITVGAIVIAPYLGSHWPGAAGSGSSSTPQPGENDSHGVIAISAVNWTTNGCASGFWIGPGFNASVGDMVNLTETYPWPPPPQAGANCTITAVRVTTPGFWVVSDNVPLAIGLQHPSTLRVEIGTPSISFRGELALVESTAWAP